MGHPYDSEEGIHFRRVRRVLPLLNDDSSLVHDRRLVSVRTALTLAVTARPFRGKVKG